MHLEKKGVWVNLGSHLCSLSPISFHPSPSLCVCEADNYIPLALLVQNWGRSPLGSRFRGFFLLTSAFCPNATHFHRNGCWNFLFYRVESELWLHQEEHQFKSCAGLLFPQQNSWRKFYWIGSSQQDSEGRTQNWDVVLPLVDKDTTAGFLGTCGTTPWRFLLEVNNYDLDWC